MSNRIIQDRLIAQRERQQQAGVGGGLPRFDAGRLQQEQVRQMRADQRRMWEAQLYRQQEQLLRGTPAVADTRSASTASPPILATELHEDQFIPLMALRQPPAQSTPIIRYRPPQPQPQQQRQYPTPPSSDDDASPPIAAARQPVAVVNQLLERPVREYAVVARSGWSEPSEMAQTYSYLYNTINSLVAQMEPGLWAKVYGEPPHRDRRLNWTRLADARRIVFISREDPDADERRRELAALPYDEYNFIPGRVTMYGGGGMKRKLSSVNNGNVPERFEQPPPTYDRRLRRWFATQYNDGYLCALHSLNNVSNAMTFAPPDILGTIESLRSLGTRFAQLEEVVLAALREGIFLVQIKLTSVNDLVPLHDAEAHPQAKYCLEALKRAGGMLVLRPSGDAGHFVSLVYSSSPDIPAGGERWGVFSTNECDVYSTTAAGALERYIFGTNRLGLSDAALIERERTARATSRRSVLDQPFIGLLPISLAALTATGDFTQSDTSSVSEADARTRRQLEVRLTRTLVRRALSEMEIRSAGLIAQEERNAQREELHVPVPISANNFDQIARDINANRLTGLEQTNPASLFVARYAIDQTLSQEADRLAQLVLQQYNGAALSEAAWQHDVAQQLRVMRGTALAELRTIGMFFTSASATEESMRKFTALHSNRRWFHYLALFVVVDALEAHLSSGRTVVITDELFQLLVLLTLLSYTNLTSYGEKYTATPHLLKLLDVAYIERALLLPLAKAPPGVLELFEGSETVEPTQAAFTDYILLNRYDSSLWLLDTAHAQRFANFGLPSVEPFRLTEEARDRVIADNERRAVPKFNRAEFIELQYDDGRLPYDQMAEFVALLRATLFMLPFAGSEYRQVATELAAVAPGQPTPLPLAAHMHEQARAFIARATTQIDNEMPFAAINNEGDAMQWIDALAFDRMFASVDDWQIIANEGQLTTHRLSVKRPRFVERALQLGFDRIHRDIFGALTMRPDQRPLIFSNTTRVPPLNAATGRSATAWEQVRPLTTPEAHLAVRPISELPH